MATTGVLPDDLPAGTTQGMVMSNSLNFRTEATADSPLIESLPYGTVLEIVSQGEAGSWHYVSFNNVRGYVYADYVRLADAEGRFFGLADDVIAYAKQFLGYRYVYGGSTPSGGFDCGGLIKYVYGHFGYSLNMGATTQYRSIALHISRAELRPGDIVYFSSPGAAAFIIPPSTLATTSFSMPRRPATLSKLPPWPRAIMTSIITAPHGSLSKK